MFSSNKLNEDQKAALVRWTEEGATMSDLQRRLGEEFGLRLTYMETRLLVLDLGLKLKEENKQPQAAQPEQKDADEEDWPDDDDDDLGGGVPAGGAGQVAVSLDELAVPGAVVSGRVTFSDGQKAMWYLDQMGRLGLDPDVAGYRPSREDVGDFQRQLSALLRKSGL